MTLPQQPCGMYHCITGYHQQKTHVPDYHTLNQKGMSGNLQKIHFLHDELAKQHVAMTCQESE